MSFSRMDTEAGAEMSFTWQVKRGDEMGWRGNNPFKVWCIQVAFITPQKNGANIMIGKFYNKWYVDGMGNTWQYQKNIPARIF